MRKAERPRLYQDFPDTRVTPLDDGWEMVQTGMRAFARKTLSQSGAKKHERLDALGELGYVVISMRGAGLVFHPSAPHHLYSIAAAAFKESLI